MAFTNASFLHKEYGMVNPAYSIAGYGSAAITGLGRNLNNRHWVPDILAGAGIGIISTELGYFFIDKIYKNKENNKTSQIRMSIINIHILCIMLDFLCVHIRFKFKLEI